MAGPDHNNGVAELLAPLDPFPQLFGRRVVEAANLIEVQFEENTDAYAITIEPFGGQQAPTLERLIGVIPISS